MTISLPLALGTFFGVTLFLVILRVRTEWERDEKRQNRLKNIVRDQVGAIRSLARDTLRLRRHTKALLEEIEKISAECNDIKESIAEAEKVDRRLYILDDRRTLVDQEWIITAHHPNYKAHVSPRATSRLSLEWMNGRRYLVWAVDRDRALDKFNNRMPKERGFVIQEVVQRTAPT